MNVSTELFAGESERTGNSFTAREFLSIVFKHKNVILFTFLGVTAAVALTLLLLPPTYVVEAKVLVKTELQGNPSFFSGIAAYREQRDPDPVNRKLETEMELLTTRSLSEEVVRKTNLRYDQVYHKPYVHFLNSLADVYYGIKHSVFGGPPSDRYGFKSTVDQFNKSLTVAPVKSKSAETSSNVIAVTLKGSDPKLAQQTAQALLDQYLNYSIALNQKSGLEAFKVVEKNTRDAAIRMEEAQGRMRKFLTERGTYQNMPYSPTERNAAAQDAFAMQVKDTAAGPVKSDAAKVRVDTVLTPGDNTSLSVLKSRLIDMELRLADLRQNFSDESGNVQVASQAIEQLKTRIQQEVNRNAEYQTTLARLDSEQKSAENLYLELKRKLDQISLFLAMNPHQVDNRVVTEPPMLPESSEWKKDLLIAGLVSLMGLVLGLGIAGYREYSDHTLQTAGDVERFLGLPMLATVPLMDDKDVSQAGRSINPSRG